MNRFVLALASGVVASSIVLHADSSFELLHRFNGGADGARPAAALIQADDGSFYGTTARGGDTDQGTIFRMTTDGTVEVLHAFMGSDGADPEGALTQGSDGNFYGTTLAGGDFGLGTVFTMAPDGTFNVLHAFSGADGAGPDGALFQGGDGSLYGTTRGGGDSNRGTVYVMAPDGTIAILHAFTGNSDGAIPHAGVILGADGNFYGTTESGGVADRGTVFLITPDGAVTILRAFSGAGTDGAAPLAGLIQTADGTFYGTTSFGGTDDRGTIFSITPDSIVTIRHSFSGTAGRPDGAYPGAALVQAADGNLYGTTRQGSVAGFGTVFRMMLDGTLTILYAFSNGTDGTTPDAALIQGADGTLYGSTSSDDVRGSGALFRLALPGPTRDRANSYDDAWRTAWVNHARDILSSAAGKTDGFVLEVGDSISHSHAYAVWPHQGEGQTADDLAAIGWADATSWGADNFDVTNKNGWFLAAADTTAQRGMTSSGGLSTGRFVSGCCNGGPDMPATTDPVVARQIIANPTYTGNLQVDTLISAFNDAQFAVVMLGTNDPANPDNVAALVTIVDELVAEHIVPILSTIPPRNDAFSNQLNIRFNAAVTELAQQRSLPLIDFYQEILLRRPGTTWFLTLISDDGLHPTASGAGFGEGSDPYLPGGDPGRHTTGDALLNVGYLLRSWLTVQKIEQVKQFVIVSHSRSH